MLWLNIYYKWRRWCCCTYPSGIILRPFKLLLEPIEVRLSFLQSLLGLFLLYLEFARGSLEGKKMRGKKEEKDPEKEERDRVSKRRGWEREAQTKIGHQVAAANQQQAFLVRMGGGGGSNASTGIWCLARTRVLGYLFWYFITEWSKSSYKSDEKQTNPFNEKNNWNIQLYL